jgi:catechol 2,3-dioxygenase-like lactoylglutathione lyase family enzyme
MKPRISLITLGTHDLARAVQFYEDGLGLPRFPMEGDVAFFTLDGSWLGLYGWEALAADAGVPADGQGFRGVALAHNVDSRDEVDRLLERAVDAGATLVRPAGDTDWGGYSGYFADPDGHLWELAWNPHLAVGHQDG